MSNLFTDPHFWLLLSFIVTMFLLVKKLTIKGKDFIDSKIDEIKDEIKESEALLVETSSLLNEKRSNLKLSKEAMEIGKSKACIQSDSYYEKAINTLNIQVKNLKVSFDTYLHADRSSKEKDLNKNISSKSIAIVEEFLTKNIDNDKHNSLIDESINNITTMLRE